VNGACSAAERVCGRPHTVSDVRLSVTMLERQPDVAVCAVQVSGLVAGVHTRDLIVLYFENEKRSGGGTGAVDDVEFDVNNATAVVTFASPLSQHLISCYNHCYN